MKKNLIKKTVIVACILSGNLIISNDAQAQFAPIAVASPHTRSTFAGNLGIGTAAAVVPLAKFHVIGTSRLQGATAIVGATAITGAATISGLTTTATLRVAGSAPGLNKILRSDATGLASWITNPVGANTISRVPRWNGTQLVTGTIFDNGTNIGIGTVAPTQKLHVIGNALVTGDVYVPGNLRNNNATTAQIIKISTTAGSDCGIQFNRPGTGFFDFRMVNIGGNLRWQGSTDEFATVNNEFMNLNLASGSLGIGTTPGTAKLSVCGTVRCTELRVETGWCDYVFAKDYKLRSLEDVAAFIEENHHLPDIDAGSVVESEGLNVGEMSAKMIRKIEELTLYVIQQNDRINALEKENVQLKNSNK